MKKPVFLLIERVQQKFINFWSVFTRIKINVCVSMRGCIMQVAQLLVAKVPSKQEILEKVRALRTALPKNFVFDRDEANAR